MECLYYDAGLVLFSLMISVLTYKDFASAFLPMLWVLFPFLSRYVVLPFIKYDNTRGRLQLMILPSPTPQEQSVIYLIIIQKVGHKVN